VYNQCLFQKSFGSVIRCKARLSFRGSLDRDGTSSGASLRKSMSTVSRILYTEPQLKLPYYIFIENRSIINGKILNKFQSDHKNGPCNMRDRVLLSTKAFSLWLYYGGTDVTCTIFLSRSNDLLTRGNEILTRGKEILSRGNELVKSWERDPNSRERDTMSWERVRSWCTKLLFL
jgi:hypothetical protein